MKKDLNLRTGALALSYCIHRGGILCIRSTSSTNKKRALRQKSCTSKVSLTLPTLFTALPFVGFVQFHQRKFMYKVKEYFGDATMHLEPMRGTAKQAADYCKKTESRYEGVDAIRGEHGELTQQGQRTDLQGIVNRVLEGATALEIVTEGDEDTTKAVARHHGFLKQIGDEHRDKKAKADLKVSFEDAKLQTWQAELVAELEKVPDARSVLWIMDEVGGQGKSWLCDYLIATHDALDFPVGKLVDMAYLWANSKACTICIFDVTRTLQKEASYDPLHGMFCFIERLKRGCVHSTKYIPRTIFRKPPHVIIMSNFAPPVKNLSLDRWRIFSLRDSVLQSMNAQDLLDLQKAKDKDLSYKPGSKEAGSSPM